MVVTQRFHPDPSSSSPVFRLGPDIKDGNMGSRIPDITVVEYGFVDICASSAIALCPGSATTFSITSFEEGSWAIVVKYTDIVDRRVIQF